MKRRNFLRYSIAGSALLSAFPDDECLQFHTAAKFIDGFTLGIESIEQLKDVQKRLPEASVRG